MNKPLVKSSGLAVWALAAMLGVSISGAVSVPVQAATKIAVLVNNVPITTNDIKRRAAFLKLRRVKGNRRKLAKEELIKEAIQMQEAARLGRVASDKQVNEAYKRFAKRNKMPLKALNQIMSRSGVTIRGFKQFIKAQMSWQAAVGLRAVSEGRSTQKKDPLGYLHGGGGSSGGKTTTEYTIQQVVFVIPRSKQKALSGRRMTEANNFRSRFTGCDNTMNMAAAMKDVSVISKGRVHSHELPPRWKPELEATRPGKTTRPLKTEKGVELLAVCKTRQVLSKLQGGQGDLFSGPPKSEKEFSALEKKYMKELRKVSVVKNR